MPERDQQRSDEQKELTTMRLIHQMAREGEVLFRWRSFIPLLILPAFLLALSENARIEAAIGEALSDSWSYFCMALSFIGLTIRGATVGFVPRDTSGRNTHGQVAEILNTTGLYSVVRNPLYLANLLFFIGVALYTKVWWFVALVVLAYWLYIERIIVAEEAYLARKFGQDYAAWVSRTPAFLPRLSNWRPPTESFSFRTVLRREHHGLLGLAIMYLVLEALLDLGMEGQPPSVWVEEDWVWLLLLTVAAAVALGLRIIKKTTGLLYVPGR